MISTHRLQCTFFGLLFAGATASAQTTTALLPPPDIWTHGTTLNVFTGGATGSHDAAGAAGGGFGWELTPRIGIEGSGTWFDWGPGARAFTAAMTTQVAVVTVRPVVPFLSAGIGVYHASFSPSNAGMPLFYRRRMTATSALSSIATFTDPSLTGGGGISVFLSRHWTLRPEVIATVVMRDSRRFVVTTGALRLGYHFEDHPVTPAVHGGRLR